MAESALLISYFPLLCGVPGLTEDVSPGGMAEIAAVLDGLPDGFAKAVLWLLDQESNSACPVLLMGRGREIAGHLIEWAEGDAPSWFRLHIAEARGRYGLALLPDPMKSVERHRIAASLAAGFAVQALKDCNIVFRPLHFSSLPGSTAFGQVRGMIGGMARVGILDEVDVGPDGPASTDPDRISWLGSFEVVRESGSGYVTQMLEKDE